jgi:HK97 family phage prohead protease
MRRLVLGSKEFQIRKLREAKESGDECLIRRTLETEIKASGEDARVLDFTISTKSVDRYGDTVNPEGWKLKAYKKNPVVLWMHDNSLLPVGKATNVRVEDGKLKSRVEFTPMGMLAFNDTVYQMLKDGYLSATSVGFVPLKYNFSEDPKRQLGIDFVEQELLEFSIVTVPANAEALIEGRYMDEVVTLDASHSVEFARHRLELLKLG